MRFPAATCNPATGNSNRKNLRIAVRLVFIEVSAVAQRKPPVVNPAAHRVTSDDAVGERRSCVRTLVRQRKETTADMEYAD